MPRLRAALVTPLSGPLSGYGRSTAAALRLWAERAASLPRPWRGVALDVRDAGPDPAAAMRRAAPSADALFGPYGSSPALAALSATRRAVWNHGGASSALRWPDVPGALNVLSPSSTYFDGTLAAVREADPRARSAAILHADTGFARDVAGGAAAAAERLGFEVSRVAFARGAAAQAAAGLPAADLLLVAGSFRDELEAARALLERPWRAAAFVGAGVEEVLAPLGAAREGLLGPAQWTATAAVRPDEGPDIDWLAPRFREAAGAEPAYPAVQAFAAGVLLARCLRDAGGDGTDAAQRDAALRLRCRTLYGAFRIHPETGLQAGHEVLTVQWQQGRRRVVWPRAYAERPLAHPRSAA